MATGSVGGDELVVRDLDRTLVDQRSGDRDAGRGEMHGLLGARRGGDQAVDRDAAELLEEIEVEPLATELTVGDRSDSCRRQLRDHGCDLAILDLAQREGVELAGPEIGAGGVDRRCAQEAAHVVGPERGVDLRHRQSSSADRGALFR
jgi:hypothetical protein